MGMGTRTEVEANERRQNGNRDRSGDGTERGAGTGVETRGRTQDGNRDAGMETRAVTEMGTGTRM